MINTVLGARKARSFGSILMHEHIRCASNDMINTFGKKWIDEDELIEYAAKIMTALKDKYGLGLMVDATPIDLGRNVGILKAVSEKSGVEIVASTGLYYFPDLFTGGRSEEDIAAWFIDECQNGMEGTDIKPGILKCAVDRGGFTVDSKKRADALAIVQKETGLPMYVHTMHDNNTANEILDAALKITDKPEKLILGHAANRPDAEYIESLLDRGCYICMDQCHCVPAPIEQIAKTLVKLCRDGYGSRILLANDQCIYSDFGKTNGTELSTEEQTARFGHIYDAVYNEFCASGGSKHDWDIMMKENPIDVLDL